MNKNFLVKISVSIILGYTSAFFWSIGEQDIAVFMVATIIFNIFFIVGENKENEKQYISFSQDMKKYRNSDLFKK